MRDREPWLHIDPMNIIYLALGCAFLVQGLQLWFARFKLEPFGPGGFPLLTSLILILVVVMITTLQVVKRDIIPSYRLRFHDVRVIRWLLIICLSVLYMFVVPKAGFIITTIVFLTILMTAFGATKKRHLAVAIGLSTVMTLIIYFAYSVVFHMPLPGMF